MDSQIWTLKIRIVDSIRKSVFERFVSWIRLQKSQITQFVSKGFVYESRILNNTPFFVKYKPGFLDLLVLLDETGWQTGL
jgi:hypothetical protein